MEGLIIGAIFIGLWMGFMLIVGYIITEVRKYKEFTKDDQ